MTRDSPAGSRPSESLLRAPPYPTTLKPYGRSLVELARDRPEVVCLSGDLTRQCEIDLFAEAFPERFIHAGMAEANMIGIAGALARDGFRPFVHTFGVFATRRPLDQIINAVAFPRLPVRILGFMPGVSSPGGPSHQAIDDVALMRSIPGMTVIDVADAVEARQVARAIVDLDGPVYVRLKRGEIPVIFSDDHKLRLDRADVLTAGGDLALFASGMMLAPALAAARALRSSGVSAAVTAVAVIKPIDAETIAEVAGQARAVITAENHLVTGGLGSAVAEVLAEAGLGRKLRRIGLRDTFAEGALTAPYLFGKYGLSTQSIIDEAWDLLGASGPAPVAEVAAAEEGEYSPVLPGGAGTSERGKAPPLRAPRSERGTLRERGAWGRSGPEDLVVVRSGRKNTDDSGGVRGSEAMSVAELTGIDVPTGLFVGGEWGGGSRGATFPVLDPATEETLADVADASADDALAAVAAAHAALPAWAATPPRQRGEILRKAFELMTARAEQFARLMSAENGKSLRDARGEATYAAEFFRWYAEEAVRIEGSLMRAPSGANRIMVQHQPVGVSLLITPWNFPAAMATRKIGPALAAGCPVVLKPAGETPLTALALAALLAEAGVPDGVVNVVTTSKTGPVMAAVMNDPRVRKLSFTGSTEVGRILLRQAADQVLNCSMELGGNAPFIIFEDADIPAAVEGALIAKMRNGGEACTAANRFYVHEAVADEFNRAFGARLAALRVGPGLEESTEIGPLVNEATRSKVAELVEGAAGAGAKVLLGGKAPARKGYFYEPTLIDGVSQGAAILGTEIFGPVAPVVRFTAEEDAIRWANATEFGLVSYVYTQDLRRGLRVAEALEAGMVGLNRGLVSDPAAPFGGVKQSGLGREGAHEGLLEFTETKYIATDW